MTDRDKMLLECDLLRGNVNRMCVTESIGELDCMKSVAMSRIEKIRNYNLKRLAQEENDEKV